MAEDLSFADEHQADVKKTGCPFACMPIWQSLVRPPFRKRHPLLWWLGFIAIITVAFFSGRAFCSYSEESDSIERIALVSITGPILDVAPTLAWIRKLEYTPTVKGILVRVDSPGGGAAASQEVYAALARVAKKIPIAVSMGATAASGGLMVSMAGEKVFANPSTVTGSIGVRMDIPQLQGLMGKLGIGQETLVTAPYKDAASYMHPMTPEDRAYLEKVLMNMHEQFVGIVAKSRRMPSERAAAIANGKIYTGQEAKELGLIDELGGQDDTHAWLAQKTGVPITRKLLERKVSTTRLLERLLALGKVFGFDLNVFSETGNFAPGWSQAAFLY